MEKYSNGPGITNITAPLFLQNNLSRPTQIRVRQKKVQVP